MPLTSREAQAGSLDEQQATEMLRQLHLQRHKSRRGRDRGSALPNIARTIEYHQKERSSSNSTNWDEVLGSSGREEEKDKCTVS